MWVYFQTYGIHPYEPGAEFAVGHYDGEGKSHFNVKGLTTEIDAMMLTSFLNGGSIDSTDLTRIISTRNKRI